MQTKVVRSKPQDAPALTKIAKAAKGCWAYPKEWMKKWEEELTISPEQIEKDFVFHLDKEGKIVAFYSLSETDGVFDIEHMWVLPEYIGKGLGKMLFEHTKETVMKNGGKKIRVESDPNAEGFYIKMGMHRTGEKESSIPDRILPVLELTL